MIWLALPQIQIMTIYDSKILIWNMEKKNIKEDKRSWLGSMAFFKHWKKIYSQHCPKWHKKYESDGTRKKKSVLHTIETYAPHTCTLKVMYRQGQTFSEH